MEVQSSVVNAHWQQQDRAHGPKAKNLALIGQNLTREDVMISWVFFPLAMKEWAVLHLIQN